MIPKGVIDAVKKFREENKTPPPSATLTTKARGQSNPTLDAIKDAGMRALQGVSTTLDAIPPSVDLYPGPVDNVAVMGLAGLNKGIKTLVKGERGMDEVVGAVNAVRALKPLEKVDDLMRGKTVKLPTQPTYYRATTDGQTLGSGQKWAWTDKASAESWAKRNNAKVVEFTVPDSAIDPIDLSRMKQGTTDRFMFDTSKANTLPKLPTQTGEITVYRGGRDMGDSRMLTPAKQNSGALFFTESEKYAKQYSKTPDQVSGLYKTNIKTDKIFDITNPQHIKQLEKHIQPEALQSMRDATNHGAVDWATASQYVDEIEKAGFKGAKFLERPAENITHLPDGSFKLEGKPVYSYALFDKQVPMTRASLPTQVEGLAETPKTVRVWKNSRFGNGGGYDDIPVIRKEENITLYQGGKAGDNRQFWTPDKKYAEQFGNVKEKTGDFYRVDNGNRVTNVYVEAPTNSPQGLEGLAKLLPEEKAMAKYPKIAVPVDDIRTGGFITTKGKIVEAVDHNQTLETLGFKNKGNYEGLNNYLDKGGIRTVVGRETGDINIEMHKAPTAEQLQALNNLPEGRRYFSDLHNKGEKTGLTAGSKQDFIKQVQDFFNQSKGVQNAVQAVRAVKK